jgi:hypothetical protein
MNPLSFSSHRKALQRKADRAQAIALLALGAAVLAALSGPAVSAWEKANGFPFGRMCNSVFTGFVDTCPVQLDKAGLKRLVDRVAVR